LDISIRLISNPIMETAWLGVQSPVALCGSKV